MERWEVLAAATRGGIDESEYRGAIAIVDPDGRLVHSVGDPTTTVFARSALKPFQALPTVAHADAIGLEDEDIAIMCASHSGEPVHVGRVARLLRIAGCGAGDLQCGSHPPLYLAPGDPPPPGGITPLHHNCSGKHAGFLVYCRHAGLPVETYLDPDNALQRRIRADLARCAGVGEDALPRAIDGCSAPAYALPLSALARAYARLAGAGGDDGMARTFRAMTRHSYLVSGRNRADDFFMTKGDGDIVAKGGAEGVQALGLRRLGLGIAIKIADGNGRAAAVCACAALLELGAIGSTDLRDAPTAVSAQIRNARGLLTGAVEPRFTLGRGV